MDERWLPVVGYEGFYEVSDLGRVRGLDRIVRSHGRSMRRHRGQMRRLVVGSGGYLQVTLARESVSQSPLVHRVVMEAFVGPRPVGLETCHNNGDRTDNRLENLRYDTPKSNQADVLRMGHNRNARKTHCIRGHEFSAENTYVASNGSRKCRTCESARLRAARMLHGKAS